MNALIDACEELKKGNKTIIAKDSLDKIVMPKIKDEDTTANFHYNNFAKQILLAGTDFSKNFFDTFLFAVQSDGKAIKKQVDAFNSIYDKSTLGIKDKDVANKPFVWKTVGMYSFTTRTTKVEIPMPKATTFDYVVGSQTIRKIRSEWDMSKKSSLTMRVDGWTYYIDAINFLSQNNDMASLEGDKSINYLSFTGLNKNLSESIKNGTRLDLVVRHINPNEPNTNNQLRNAERTLYSQQIKQDSYVGMVNTRPDNARSMFWVFEDVRFLGWNDGLEFGHSSTGPQELTTDFTFKRLFRVDPMYLENYVGNLSSSAKIADSHLSSEIQGKYITI